MRKRSGSSPSRNPTPSGGKGSTGFKGRGSQSSGRNLPSRPAPKGSGSPRPSASSGATTQQQSQSHSKVSTWKPAVTTSPPSAKSSVPAPQRALVPPPQTASVPVPQNASVPPPQNASILPPQNASVPTPKAASVPAPQTVSVPAPQIASVPAPQTVSVPAPQTASVPAPKTASVPAPEIASVPTPQAASESVPQTASVPATQTASGPVPQLFSVPSPQIFSLPAPQIVSGSVPLIFSAPAPQIASVLPTQKDPASPQPTNSQESTQTYSLQTPLQTLQQEETSVLLPADTVEKDHLLELPEPLVVETDTPKPLQIKTNPDQSESEKLPDEAQTCKAETSVLEKFYKGSQKQGSYTFSDLAESIANADDDIYEDAEGSAERLPVEMELCTNEDAKQEVDKEDVVDSTIKSHINEPMTASCPIGTLESIPSVVTQESNESNSEEANQKISKTEVVNLPSKGDLLLRDNIIQAATETIAVLQNQGQDQNQNPEPSA